MNLPNFQQSPSLAAILRDVSKWSLADINQAGRSKTVRNTYESIQMNFTFNSRGKIWNCSLFIDRLQAFCERLYGEIKRKLYSGRRENPKVRIEIQVNDDILNASLGRITSKWYQRNKLIYEIISNETLDFYIGTKWNGWIMNENGDFAYVVPGTLKFRLTKRNPMVEFKLIGGKCVEGPGVELKVHLMSRRGAGRDGCFRSFRRLVNGLGINTNERKRGTRNNQRTINTIYTRGGCHLEGNLVVNADGVFPRMEWGIWNAETPCRLERGSW